MLGGWIEVLKAYFLLHQRLVSRTVAVFFTNVAYFGVYSFENQ